MSEIEHTNFSLVKKVALVTGSTSGIGLATAHKLAAAGCDIVLHGLLSDEDGQALKNEFEANYSCSCLFSNANLASSAAIDQMFNEIKAKYQKLDIVINNAGIQFTAAVEEFPLDKWNQILNINLTAAFYVTQQSLPLMQKNNWGRVINIASVHGLVASVHKAAYVAAKHGLVGFTKVAAVEQATKGITVNAICPGWVETPLIKNQIESIAKKEGVDFESAKNKLITAKQPLPEMANADQIGDMVMFLCSDSARSITGSSMTIDGGWTAI